MHRSSESIGTIAAALAKAQAELTNPEKSLVATIRSPFPREADRSFRYAPLSSGLDIVRKSLGRHEIATIQTTAIDKEAGLLRLTTVLAHSSGEWVSSEWPVCQLGDIASAQRMGAALTYARRYSLFTLVEIAGEDDLDAPDLAPPKPGIELPQPNQRSHSNGGGAVIADKSVTRGSGKPAVRPARPILAAEESAILREQFVAELVAINSADEATSWAHRNLPAKNTLKAEDAQAVEEQFQARLSAIAEAECVSSSPAAPNEELASHETSKSKKRPHAGPPWGLGKTIRLRDKQHIKFVSLQGCLVCGRVPSDAHHLTFTQPRALGKRVSDEFTVPVCRMHHRELHRSADEASWWGKLNIDALSVALQLWQHTRGDDKLLPQTENTPAISS